MKKKFEAFLREENSLRELAITDAGKPEVDQAFVQRWQSIINLIAMEAKEPVALILRVTEKAISILLQSENESQYNIEEYLVNGLYCEFDLGKSGLLIANRASSHSQEGDPASMPSITACFGLPVQWPDGTLFGVICVLNNPGKVLKPTYRSILNGLRETIEQELILLVSQRQTPQSSETDDLTSIYNKKKIEDILKHEFERAKRYFKTFSVTMIDLNGLQEPGVSPGVGDDALKAFAKSIGSKIRETDFWGRWGGDVFILVCPYADTVETQQMFTRIRPMVNRDMKALEAYSDFYYGVSQYEPDDLTFQTIIKRAEDNMHQYKEMIKRKPMETPDRKNASFR